MNKKSATLETRMEKLEAAVKAHERRLATLEARLDPNRLSATALELLLNELAEQGGNHEA